MFLEITVRAVTAGSDEKQGGSMSKELKAITAELQALGEKGATLQQLLLTVMNELEGEKRAEDVYVAIMRRHNPGRVLTIRALTILRDEMAAQWRQQQLAEKRSA